MADQSVRIANLPQNEAQVGMEFYKILRNRYATETLADEFALFTACVAAARGHNYTVPDFKK